MVHGHVIVTQSLSTKSEGRETTKPQALGKSTRLLCLKLVLEVYHLHLNFVVSYCIKVSFSRFAVQ